MMAMFLRDFKSNRNETSWKIGSAGLTVNRWGKIGAADRRIAGDGKSGATGAASRGRLNLSRAGRLIRRDDAAMKERGESERAGSIDHVLATRSFVGRPRSSIAPTVPRQSDKGTYVICDVCTSGAL